jgi:hypothetical protein
MTTIEESPISFKALLLRPSRESIPFLHPTILERCLTLLNQQLISYPNPPKTSPLTQNPSSGSASRRRSPSIARRIRKIEVGVANCDSIGSRDWGSTCHDCHNGYERCEGELHFYGALIAFGVKVIEVFFFSGDRWNRKRVDL